MDFVSAAFLIGRGVDYKLALNLPQPLSTSGLFMV